MPPLHVGAAAQRGHCAAGANRHRLHRAHINADPRYRQQGTDLGDLIVDSMTICLPQVRALIAGYDRYFGEGAGEAFFMGPYLDVLPTAVEKWAKDRRQ